MLQGPFLLLGDLMIYLKAIGACEYSDNISVFCERYGLREKAVREVRKLRAQLTNTGTKRHRGGSLCPK